jgi:uncharacterized protein
MPRSKFSARDEAPEPSWLSLLILQPSPFCNINCDYCYLPDRAATHRMTFETLERIVDEVFSTDLIREDLTLVWHAGEPLAVPVGWYGQAVDLIARRAPAGTSIRHCFQSNGTLLNDRWCDFIIDHGVCMGLSIDGPDFLHDTHRKTRKGQGTHTAAMRGAALLQRREIPFHVICVVTADALDHADEIFDFFVRNGIYNFGFNIEEQEGTLEHSTLDAPTTDERIREFYQRIFERQRAEDGRVRVREFDMALQRIMGHDPQAVESFPYFNEQVRPFGILSFDWQGNFSTFSPELLGLPSEAYGDFSFGSIHGAHFLDAVETPKFRAVIADVRAGVEACRAECPYFGVCGGGAPANKYFENGTFASTETMYCRYSIQAPMRIVMADLERSI